VEEAMAADEVDTRLVFGKESRNRLEAHVTHAEGGTNGLSLPVDGCLGHLDTDVVGV
jgi:hypothetical protein